MSLIEQRIERIEKALEMLGVKLPPIEEDSAYISELRILRMELERIRAEQQNLERKQREQQRSRSPYHLETYRK